MKHIHAELIKAWADGAEIQVKYVCDTDHWEDRDNPLWLPEAQYRIKPEPKPDTHIHYRYNQDNRTLTECYVGQRGDLLITVCGETGELKRVVRLS
jgi:hypothetical protein